VVPDRIGYLLGEFRVNADYPSELVVVELAEPPMVKKRLRISSVLCIFDEAFLKEIFQFLGNPLWQRRCMLFHYFRHRSERVKIVVRWFTSEQLNYRAPQTPNVAG